MQRLYVSHALAVLAFELANRAYFATFDVLVAEDCSVPGRLNLSLVFTEDGTAELGYRVAQHVVGRGVATTTVRESPHGRRAAQDRLEAVRDWLPGQAKGPSLTAERTTLTCGNSVGTAGFEPATP